MHLTADYFNAIAATVAAIVALSLTLSSALGPSIMLITESIKSAGIANDGRAGLVAIFVSVFVCSILGVITIVVGTPTYRTADLVAAAIVGAFVGIFVGAGAIRSYKTAVTVNPTSIPTGDVSMEKGTALESDDEPETVFDSPPQANPALNQMASTSVAADAAKDA